MYVCNKLKLLLFQINLTTYLPTTTTIIINILLFIEDNSILDR